MNIGKIAVRVVVVAGFAVAAVAQYQAQQTIADLRRENDGLKQQVAQIAPLQEQVARAAQDSSAASSAETQTHELARLRGEVQRLRTQTNQLARAQQEIQTLQQRVESEAETARNQAATLQAQSQAQAAPQRDQRVVNMNACINNLRLIDAAKQQWALEYRKGAADTPTWDDLRPYLGHGPNGELPICPDGGVYTIGTISEKPTCGVAGHALP